MSSQDVVAPTHGRPAPGTGRLGVVAAFFLVAGLATGAMTILTAKYVLSSVWHRQFEARALGSILLGGLLTFGYLRTDRLLSQRRKAGAVAALICLGGSVVSAFVRGDDHVAAGLAVAGVILLATVWRHLE